MEKYRIFAAKKKTATGILFGFAAVPLLAFPQWGTPLGAEGSGSVAWAISSVGEPWEKCRRTLRKCRGISKNCRKKNKNLREII